MLTFIPRQEEGLATIYANKETFLLGGVRSGKSMVITEAAIQAAFHWETEVNGILAAPTFGQLERNLLEPWRELAPKGKYEEVHGGKDPHIDCRVGRGKYVKIYLASGKHPETIEGATVGWIGGTELQQMERFWRRAMRRVSDARANKLRWFGDGLTEEGWLSKEIERPGLVELRFSTLDNEHNLAEGYLDKMAETLTPRQWDIYILGKFAAPEDSVYPTFVRAVHSVDLRGLATYANLPDLIDRRYPVIIGQDFNLNPMASVMCQFINGVLYVIGELIEPGHLQEHAEKLKAWCEARKLDHKDQRQVFIVPDATGGRRNQGDGRSNLYILQQAGFTVRARPANPLKIDTDQTVLVLLENAKKERRLFFSRATAPKTIDAIASLRQSDRDNPLNPHTHPTDALKYVAYYCAPMKAPSRPVYDPKEKTPASKQAQLKSSIEAELNRQERRSNKPLFSRHTGKSKIFF